MTSGAPEDRATQRPKLLALFAAAMVLTGGSIFVSRVTRDALFLARFDRSVLAYMYVTSAISIAVPGLLYSVFFHRIPTRAAILWAQVVGAAAFVAFALFGASSGSDWPLLALYNFVELFAVLSTIQSMTLAGDCFSTRDAKRAFPIIGAAGMFGAIGFGLASSLVLKLKLLSTVHLFFVAAALVALKAVLLVAILRQARGAGPAKAARKVRAVPLWQVLSGSHAKVIAAMTVASTLIVSVVDFQFKAFSQAHFSEAGALRVDEMSAFLGVFYAVTYVAAALLQVFVTGRLIQGAGLVTSLLVFPAAMVMAAVGLLSGVASNFAMGVGLKGSEGFLRFGLYNTASETLYLALPAHVRARAKTLVEGVLQPAAGAATGLLLALLVSRLNIPPRQLGAVSLVGSLVWLGFILRARKGYLAELLAGLRQTRVGIGGVIAADDDEDAVARTVEALHVGLALPEARNLRMVLQLMPTEASPHLGDELHRLLDRPEPDIRARALGFLGEHPGLLERARLDSSLQDPTEDVRAAAVLAARSLPTAAAVAVASPLLDTSSPLVRGSAATVLMATKVPEWIARSEEIITSLVESNDERERAAAARALATLADPKRHPVLLGLLSDSSIQVQRASIAAATATLNPETIPVLVYLLGHASTRGAASDALRRFGGPATAELTRVLNDSRESLVVRRQIPRILAHLPSPQSLDALMIAVGSSDHRIRRDSARAAAHVSETLQIPVHEAMVRTQLEIEVHRYLQHATVLSDLSKVLGTEGRDIMREAVEDFLRASKDIALCLLALIYPPTAIHSIRASLASGDEHLTANALEALETLLNPADRKVLLPIFERTPAQLAAMELESPLKHQSVEAWLQEFLVSDDSWLVAVALHTVTELGLSSLADHVKPLLRHDSAAVREAAAKALSCMLAPAEFGELCAHLKDDAVGQVRDNVRSLLVAAGLEVADARPRLRKRERVGGAALVATGDQPAASKAPSTVTASLDALAALVRVAVLLRLDGDSFQLKRIASKKALDAAASAPIPLGPPSILQRSVASRTMVLDEVDEITETEAAMLKQLGLAAPTMRAVIPMLRDGLVRGVLYLDTEGREISGEDLEAAMAVATAEALYLG